MNDKPRILRFYADDSGYTSESCLKENDIFIYGGILIDDDAEIEFKDNIEKIKKQFNAEGMPIKWNLKGDTIKNFYQESGHEKLYKSLLKGMPSVRNAIFNSVKDIDFKIVVSIVESYSKNKSIIIQKKEDLNRYVFINSLQHFAMDVKNLKPDRVEVILDWPSGEYEHRNIYLEEYRSAYCDAKDMKDENYYTSGDLNNLNFCEMPFFTATLYSTMLQFADMTVGVLREFLKLSLERKAQKQCVELLRMIANKFYRNDNKIFGYSIVINKEAEFKEEIESLFLEKIFTRVQPNNQ